MHSLGSRNNGGLLFASFSQLALSDLPQGRNKRQFEGYCPCLQGNLIGAKNNTQLTGHG